MRCNEVDVSVCRWRCIGHGLIAGCWMVCANAQDLLPNVDEIDSVQTQTNTARGTMPVTLSRLYLFNMSSLLARFICKSRSVSRVHMHIHIVQTLFRYSFNAARPSVNPQATTYFFLHVSQAFFTSSFHSASQRSMRAQPARDA